MSTLTGSGSLRDALDRADQVDAAADAESLRRGLAFVPVPAALEPVLAAADEMAGEADALLEATTPTIQGAPIDVVERLRDLRTAHDRYREAVDDAAEKREAERRRASGREDEPGDLAGGAVFREVPSSVGPSPREILAASTAEIAWRMLREGASRFAAPLIAHRRFLAEVESGGHERAYPERLVRLAQAALAVDAKGAERDCWPSTVDRVGMTPGFLRETGPGAAAIILGEARRRYRAAGGAGVVNAAVDAGVDYATAEALGLARGGRHALAAPSVPFAAEVEANPGMGPCHYRIEVQADWSAGLLIRKELADVSGRRYWSDPVEEEFEQATSRVDLLETIFAAVLSGAVVRYEKDEGDEGEGTDEVEDPNDWHGQAPPEVAEVAGDETKGGRS